MLLRERKLNRILREVRPDYKNFNVMPRSLVFYPETSGEQLKDYKLEWH